VRQEFVSLLDVAPTITRLMGLKPLPHFRGRNLLRLKKGQVSEFFEETYRPEALEGDKFALLHYPWHLILTPQDRRYELFDWSEDPFESHDLLGEKSSLPAEVAEIKQRLEAFARDVLKGKEEIKIDKKTEEILRGLGYVK
jgi:arylsulfatase A-like enzyme